SLHLYRAEGPWNPRVRHELELPARRLLVVGEAQRRDREERESDRHHPDHPAHRHTYFGEEELQLETELPVRSVVRRDRVVVPTILCWGSFGVVWVLGLLARLVVALAFFRLCRVLLRSHLLRPQLKPQFVQFSGEAERHVVPVLDERNRRAGVYAER